MTSIEDTTKKVDLLLQDRGLTSEYQEQAVRQLLYHLFVAIEIYKFMTVAERNKSGWWYRTYFKNIFPLSGFLKERKRKRDKEKSPLHPSYKKESGVLEKGKKSALSITRGKNSDLKERQMAFWKELLKYEAKYDHETLQKFYYVWSEEVSGTGKMRWEMKSSWSLGHRLAMFPKKSYQLDDKAAALRLNRAKQKSATKSEATEQQVAIARERMMEQERREREFAENKAKAVSHEEWLAMKKE